MAGLDRSRGIKLERSAFEPADRGPVRVDRPAAALIGLIGLYTVLFGTPIVDWVWYALALVFCAGWLLWRSLKERHSGLG